MCGGQNSSDMLRGSCWLVRIGERIVHLTKRHTFKVELMIVEDGLAPKPSSNLLDMDIFFIPVDQSTEFVEECLIWRKGGLEEAIPLVHVLVCVDRLAENEIYLIRRRVGELTTKKLELLDRNSGKILTDLHERSS